MQKLESRAANATRAPGSRTSQRLSLRTQAVVALLFLLVAWQTATRSTADCVSRPLSAPSRAPAARRDSLRFPEARPPTPSTRIRYANSAVQDVYPSNPRQHKDTRDEFEPLWESSAVAELDLPPAGVFHFRRRDGSGGRLTAANVSLCHTGACSGWSGMRFDVNLEAGLEHLQQSDPASEMLVRLPTVDAPLAGSVTLVTQLSVSRLPRFDRLLDAWNGPVSATVYLVDEDDLEPLSSYLRNLSSPASARPTWSRLTLTILKPSYATDESSMLARLRYPINRLRNLAIEAAASPYILVIDVDFVPSPGMHDNLVRHAIPLIENPYSNSNAASPTLRRTAVVIPTFALALGFEGEMPTTMDRLEELYGSEPQLAMLTDPNSGHGPTSPARLFHQWRSASSSSQKQQSRRGSSDASYEVCYEPQWEPYYVLHRASHPYYDERFTDQGGDKQSHALVLNALGYSFRVLVGDGAGGGVWVMHPPKTDLASEAWPAARLGAERARAEGTDHAIDAGDRISATEAGEKGLVEPDSEREHFNFAAQRDQTRFRYFQDFLPEMERVWGKWTARWPRGCSVELVAAGRFFGRARPRSVFGL
ncbi:hypothetical protein JCM3774_004680 [Rhodotorula dairenensis]